MLATREALVTRCPDNCLRPTFSKFKRACRYSLDFEVRTTKFEKQPLNSGTLKIRNSFNIDTRVTTRRLSYENNGVKKTLTFLDLKKKKITAP